MNSTSQEVSNSQKTTSSVRGCSKCQDKVSNPRCHLFRVLILSLSTPPRAKLQTKKRHEAEELDHITADDPHHRCSPTSDSQHNGNIANYEHQTDHQLCYSSFCAVGLVLGGVQFYGATITCRKELWPSRPVHRLYC